MRDKINELKNNRFLKNVAHIFSGTVIGSLLGVFNTALLVQSIGLEKNGIIFLGLSYAAFFNSLFNFQAFEAVIKFLPSCMDYGNKRGKNIIQQAFMLDLITAVFAFIVAYFFLSAAGKYFKWSPEIQGYIGIINLTILFTLTGAFTGVLRIFEKFKYISILGITGTAINTVMYLIGHYMKLDFPFYVYSVLISSIFNTALMGWYTYITLKEHGMNNWSLLKTEYDWEFIRFTLFTNLTSTLDIPVAQLTPFIINKYLGFSDIAVFKILERIGQLITRVTGIISQVLMPEISKRLASKDRDGAYRIGYKIGKLVAAVGVAGFIFVLLTHKFWLHYFIPDYSHYMAAVYLYLFYVIFTQMFMAQHPIFIYSGYVKENTYILIFVNAVYLALLLYAAKLWGIPGVIGAKIVQAALVFIFKGLVLQKKHK